MNNITKTLLGSVLVLGSLFTGVTETKAATAIRTETKCNYDGVCYTTQTVVDVCNDTGRPNRYDYPFTTVGSTNYINDYRAWKESQSNCVSF